MMDSFLDFHIYSHYTQARCRIKYIELARQGIIYSDMPKFTDSGDNFDEFQDKFLHTYFLLNFTAILKNHQDFLKMLYHKNNKKLLW